MKVAFQFRTVLRESVPINKVLYVRSDPRLTALQLVR